MKSLLIFCVALCFSCSRETKITRLILNAQEQTEEGKYKDALETYNEILNLKINSEIENRIIFQKAKLYHLYIQNFEQAKLQYKLILNLADKPFWQILGLEGIAKIELDHDKEYNSCFKHYQKLKSFLPKLELYDSYENLALECAFKSSSEKNLSDAGESILIIDHHPLLAKFRWYEGLSLFNKGKYQESIDLWAKNLTQIEEPYKAKVKFYMGLAYENLEQLEKAYKMFYSVLKTYPEPDAVQYKLESLYQRRVERKR
ncbi:MAG: hypothetical protein H6620_10315 [Halobacteriovoraceae bacterium]|nr:hypothetical protein [Halobacteriovoraceae bacterium]